MATTSLAPYLDWLTTVHDQATTICDAINAQSPGAAAAGREWIEQLFFPDSTSIAILLALIASGATAAAIAGGSDERL